MRCEGEKLLAACLTLLVFPAGSNAGQTMPGADDMKRARMETQKAMPSARIIEEQRKRVKDQLRAFNPAAVEVPSFPRIGISRKRSNVDDAVRNSLKAMRHEWQNEEGVRLLVFVSFSMPREGLRLLLSQASQAGAEAVIRGPVADSSGRPSFAATAKAIRELKMNSPAGVSVDPKAFRTFDIRKVPAFVVTLPHAEGTEGSDYLVAYGDVSLAYAVKRFTDSNPSVEALLAPYLARLRQGFFEETGRASE